MRPARLKIILGGILNKTKKIALTTLRRNSSLFWSRWLCAAFKACKQAELAAARLAFADVNGWARARMSKAGSFLPSSTSRKAPPPVEM